MRIVLLRHGEPKKPTLGRCTVKEFKGWIEAYDKALISNQSTPRANVAELVINCNYIVCSNLVRSVDSAKKLGLKPHLISKKFREMELPYSEIPIGLKLAPSAWMIIFRVLWVLGYSKNSESFHDAKTRASLAANILENLAKDQQQVLFVGHGFLNKYMAKQLTKNGWLSLNKLGSKYWEYGVFEKPSR